MKTLPEQLASAKRELALRRNTYPKWIESKRMKQESADHEIDCMESIVATLEKMVMLAEVSEEMKAKVKPCSYNMPPVEIIYNPVAEEFELVVKKTCQCCGADRYQV
jgi:hypothetical protein